MTLQTTDLQTTSLGCKLLEHFIVSNTTKLLEKHNILKDCQHGFRTKRSCETQILTIYHKLAPSLFRKIQRDMVIFDVSKTFDCVTNQRLLYGPTHRDGSIASFLSSRIQQVIVEGQSARESFCDQGSILGPALFLSTTCQTILVPTRMITDDCIVYRENKSMQDQNTMTLGRNV